MSSRNNKSFLSKLWNIIGIRLIIIAVSVLISIMALGFLIICILYIFNQEKYFNIVSLITLTSIVGIYCWYKSLRLNKSIFKKGLCQNKINLSKLDKENVSNEISNNAVITYISLLITFIAVLISFLLANIPMSYKYSLLWIFVILIISVCGLFERKLESLYEELLEEYKYKYKSTSRFKDLTKIYLHHTDKIQQKIMILRNLRHQINSRDNKKIHQLKTMHYKDQIIIKKLKNKIDSLVKS